MKQVWIAKNINGEWFVGREDGFDFILPHQGNYQFKTQSGAERRALVLNKKLTQQPNR